MVTPNFSPSQSEISSRIKLATAYKGYECRYSCTEKGYPENLTPREITDNFSFRKRCRLRNVPREPLFTVNWGRTTANPCGLRIYA